MAFNIETDPRSVVFDIHGTLLDGEDPRVGAEQLLGALVAEGYSLYALSSAKQTEVNDFAASVPQIFGFFTAVVGQDTYLEKVKKMMADIPEAAAYLSKLFKSVKDPRILGSAILVDDNKSLEAWSKEAGYTWIDPSDEGAERLLNPTAWAHRVFRAITGKDLMPQNAPAEERSEGKNVEPITTRGRWKPWNRWFGDRND